MTVIDSVGDVYDLNVPFGDLTEGLSLTKAVIVVNNTNAEIKINEIRGLDLPFSIEENSCTSRIIKPAPADDHCTIIIGFSPETTGPFANTLEILPDTPDMHPAIVSLSGTGLLSDGNNPPSIPKLVSPENNEAGLGTSIEFVWEKSLDPDSDWTIYHLYYSESPYFINSTHIQINSPEEKKKYFSGSYMNMVLFGSVFAGVFRRKKSPIILIMIITILISVSCGSGSSEETSIPTPVINNKMIHTESGLKTETTYYWKIVADDENGGIIESGVNIFTTG